MHLLELIYKDAGTGHSIAVSFRRILQALCGSLLGVKPEKKFGADRGT